MTAIGPNYGPNTIAARRRACGGAPPDPLGLDGHEEGKEDQKAVQWTVFPT